MTHSYEQLVKTSTLFTVFCSIFLVGIKLISCWLTGSLSLLASLIDSSMDLIASGLNFFLVRYALKPADRSHLFGHGKAESLSALAQSGFIIGSAVILLLTSIKTVIHPNDVKLPLLGIAASLVSVMVTGILVFYQRKVIKLTKSKAIYADMLHYFADFLMNIGVIAALLLSWYGFAFADAVFSMLVASYLAYSAGKVAWSAIHDLLDKALSDEDNNRIRQIVSSFPEISGLHELKTRQAASTRFIQLHIELDDDMPLIKAHAIADNLEKQLLESFHPAEVIIHQDPKSSIVGNN